MTRRHIPFTPRRLGPACAAALAISSLACSGDGPLAVRDVGTTVHEISSDGTSRSYRLFVPENVGPDARPLLLVFHGATQSASGIELLSWMYPWAEREGMVVAYPEASGDYWNTPNSPPAFWGVRDVPFIDAVIEDIAARRSVDRDRVYVAGFSNGAIFAQVVACLRGSRIAGLAIVGAGVSADVSVSCPWERRVPAVAFFGDRDPQFFWDDGLAVGTGMLGGAGSADWLGSANDCDPDPVIEDLPETNDGDTSVELWRYQACADNADVDFYRIRGGGHTWPGSPINLGPGLGRKARGLDASEVMVDFFLAHPLPQATR